MATGEIKALYFADGVTVTAGPVAPFGTEFSVAFNGSETSKVIDVSSITSEAEDFEWQLKKSTGEIILATITGFGSSVTISTDEIALAAGTYLLIGV